MGQRDATARRIEEIDWRTWEAHDPATLVFVVRAGRILLIRKKRGLGAGKINGPGGRMERGESPLDGALREVQEELRTTPTGLEICGENRFQFVDGYSTHVYVFRASGCDPEPEETEEAAPIWTPVERIPYDQMWEDDDLWLPLVLRGRQFSGRFIFDGDRMLDYEVEEEPQPAHSSALDTRPGEKVRLGSGHGGEEEREEDHGSEDHSEEQDRREADGGG